MPETAAIINRPFWARVLLLFWAVEVVMGLSFARLGASWLGPSENGMAVLLLALGLLLATAGVVMTGLCWRIAWLEGAALEMSPQGLQDRRLAPDVIPWEALSWKVAFNGRAYSLGLELEEGYRARFRPYWHQRATGLFNRLLGYPEFTVATLGTGLSAQDIGLRLRQFKAPIDHAK